jgi:hypothetical protein
MLKGYKAFPSSKYQELNEAHFNGVYTLQRHVIKRKNEKMVGANLELCFEGIRDTDLNRKKFAKIFVKTINLYQYHFFN